MEQSSSRSFEKSSRSTDTQTKHTTDHAWAVEPNVVTVSGRIQAIRSAGTKLLFIDIVDQPGAKLQVVVDANKLYIGGMSESPNPVKAFRKLIQRGDTIHVTGSPYTTTAGELSLRAVQLPRLTSPCLHQIPETSFGVDSDFAHDRHVQMLTDPAVVKGLIARARIIEGMSDFLRGLQFVNVQTPILAASAGGANARSFETSATEFPDRKLALRIAPELWLKRLIVGGMQKVFEIGPSFRNEGLDKTHNPEFTTCEFYAVNWSLETLQRETTKMIRSIVRSLGNSTSPSFVNSIGDAHTIDEPSPWPSIDFIPALNKVLELDLPDLSYPSAREQIVEIFKTRSLTLPTTPTLPRLLDKLSSIYLEPQCRTATWIINMPECMSPLAKSFSHPQLPHQQVSARAELFIDHKEVVNCYEEENSPIEQRRKLIDQQGYARLGQEVDEEAMKIDEDYIRALEWGLPTTGGWGCGIDRLCMLMLGKDNISDVLAFGNLRSVTRGAGKWEKSHG
ncbi:mitochondrial lysine-tRNA synthetase [Lithohypha guttulata]|uniref:mitochondrial lysine-tRNA synthetase n=1 Tax=Lithohypha guttulata TaxID=1690604 RepID=UPI00315CA87D